MTDTMTVITDPNGQVLFNLRNKVIAIHKTFVAEDSNGNEIFRVKKKLARESSLPCAPTIEPSLLWQDPNGWSS